MPRYQMSYYYYYFRINHTMNCTTSFVLNLTYIAVYVKQHCRLKPATEQVLHITRVQQQPNNEHSTIVNSRLLIRAKFLKAADPNERILTWCKMVECVIWVPLTKTCALFAATLKVTTEPVHSNTLKRHKIGSILEKYQYTSYPSEKRQQTYSN